MGRPRGSGKNTAMVNGRVTAEQMEWLLARADELDGNLSAALRQTITDARLLETAREDFDTYCALHPDFELPRHENEGTWVWAVFLSTRFTDAEDTELRQEEQDKNAD
jgi:hypothetical protein